MRISNPQECQGIEILSGASLAPYYIDGFSRIAGPLFALTHKGNELTMWSTERENVFK